MFLAPLNYDRYFSKVFSDERISKSFLQDFLEADIKEFEILKGKHRVTDNTEEDFQEYMDDEIFCEIIKRINKKELSEDDFQYIENERTIREEVERFEGQIYEDGREEGREEGRAEGMERGKQQGKKENAFDVAVKLKAKGFDDDIIAEVTGLSLEEISLL